MTPEEIKLRRLAGQHLLAPADTQAVVKGLCGVQAQFLSHAFHEGRTHFLRPVFFRHTPFMPSTNSASLAVISTQAGRKPLRMALRTDLILHQAAQ